MTASRKERVPSLQPPDIHECERFATARASTATNARSCRRVTALLRPRLLPSACAGASDTVAPVTGTFRLATLWLVALGACRARPAEPSPDAGPALTLLKQ